MRCHRSGYILPLVLMIVAVLTSIATYMYYRGSAYASFVPLITSREKAKVLALGGVQLAIAQLSAVSPEKKQPTPAPTAQQPDVQKQTNGDSVEQPKKFLASLLPLINRWQEVKFERGRDKIDGRVSIYISCENGKLNLNELLARASQPIKGVVGAQPQPIFVTLAKSLNLTQEIFSGAMSWWAARKGVWINEVTELVEAKGFAPCAQHLFVEPKTEDAKETVAPVCLADLFTVWTEPVTLEPWLMSESLIRVLGGRVERAGFNADRRTAKDFEALLRDFKVRTNWKTEWDKVIKPLHAVTFAQVPVLIGMMINSEFNPTTFSIVSHARVADVTQRVCAIVCRAKQSSDAATFDVIKLYWL